MATIESLMGWAPGSVDAIVGAQGVPTGGTTGQFLKKNTNTNYDCAWDDAGGGTATDTVASETSFGVSANAGVASAYARGDHTHGTPTDPITAHAAAADPHAGYQKESEKGAINGYASLDAGGAVPDAQIPSTIARDSELPNLAGHAAAADPHTGYQRESEKGAVNGYASLDAGGTVPDAQIPTTIARDSELPDLAGHAAAADPHAGYRLESTDHTHETTGAQAGQLDHGLALTGLTDDDHTQYLKEKISGGLASEVPEHTHASAAEAGQVSLDNLSGAVATAQIEDDAVTYAKLQNVSATSRVLGRKTAGAGDTEECTLSEVLDFIGSAAQGDILYRDATSWARLAAGTSGQFLKTQGTGANPTWAATGGGGEAFPVGAVFIAVVSTNPATLLGYGTWSQIAAGRMLIGQDAGDVDFDTAEEIGGSKTVTLTTTELPAHTHTENAPSSASAGALKFAIDTNASGTQASGLSTGSAGSGAAFLVMNPYFVVYCWKRTA